MNKATHLRPATMYSLKSDLAQKKKKQALRRLSQTGQKGTSPSASGRTYAGALRGRRGGRGRGRGVPSVGMKSSTTTRQLRQMQKQQNNPFLVASTSVSGQNNSSQNPFLGGGKTVVTATASSSSQPTSHMNQLAPPSSAQQSSINPFLANKPITSATSGSQPPSYASIVSGGAATQAVRPPPGGPVPTFITHGPSSVQMLPEGNLDLNPASIQTTNQFISAPSSLQSSQPPGTGINLIGQPKFQVPINVTIPQFPPHTQSDMSQAPPTAPPPYQPPSYNQATLLSTYRPAMHMQMPAATAVPPQDQGGALPLNMTLHVKGVPPELNNEAFMEKHFSRFGPLNAVECHPQKRYATVTFQNKESAVKAKRSGKILSSKYRPVQMFWQSIPIDKPTYTNQANSIPPTGAAGNQQQQLNERWKEEGDGDSGLEDGAQADSLQQGEETGERSLTFVALAAKKPVMKGVVHAAKQSSARSRLVTRVATENKLTGTPSGVKGQQQIMKKSIWDRLGGRAGETSGKQATVGGKGKSKANEDDQEWQPEGEDGGEQGGGQDEDEGEGEEVKDALIMPRELADLGLKTTGDEMDTIARYVEHPYFLRSLTQSEAYPGPKTRDKHKVVQQQQPQQKQVITVQKPELLQVQGVDSRQAYDIPSPQLPPPPRPKGTSANDLYESLDARDQEIRKAMVKQTSLTSAKTIVGTCPDMCPEKERYRRQDTHRLSWFEVDFATYEPRNAKVDHSKAIKEYSGSAADKEEPLPHELRPIGVLQMTMDYLVTMVMDEGRDRPGDWYDFVWNRTRAIRKDITLQHLSTYECVELTEKCARFHILCAYLLCEEDMSDFSPKLNSENLNKCLLSLKEFYRDLRHQQGLICPNEAEFCGYDILFHLTDGDVLNLVEKYSPGVRQQPPVRFAVETALALDSNNFVKFFKMVKNTTFLNACIMHGYFTVVRTRALRTMNRAHSVMRKPAPFPLDALARMLAFPNARKAGEFCAEFQLVVGEEMVEFMRSPLQDPAEAIPRKRSLHLVDVKNTKSLGEYVNGGPLPPPPIHTPYSSFSPGAQLRSREPSPHPAPPTAPPPQPVYSTIDMALAVNDIVDEVVCNDSKDLVQEYVQELEAIETKEQAFVSVCSSLVDDTVVEESHQVAGETLLEEVDAHSVKKELSQRLIERVLLEVVYNETLLVIHNTYRDCVVEAEAKSAATLSVTSSLVEEGVSECVKAVVEEALDKAWQEKMEHLEALRIGFERKQLLKYWKRWSHVLSVRQHVHKCVAAIPPLPPAMTLPWQLEVLLPNEKRRRVESMSLTQNTVAQLLEESREDREKKRKEFLSSLDLPSLLQEPLLLSRMPQGTLTSSSQPHSTTQYIFWKLAFVFRSQSKLTPRDSRIVEWLYHKLQFQPINGHNDATHTPLSPSEVELQTLSLTSTPILSKAGAGTLPVVEGENVGKSRQLCLAIKGCCDEILWRNDEALARELCGTCAVVLFLPTPQYFDQTAESIVAYVLQVVERVVSKRSSPRVPLLILCSNEMEEKFLAMWIQIRMALTAAHHSSFSVVHYLLVDLSSTDSSCQSEKQFAQALCQLAKSSPSQPNLFHQPIREFVEQGLLKHFVSLVVSDGDVRRKACLPSQLPAPIVSLYNTVIQYLIKTATSDDVQTLNWPIVEFVSSRNFSHGGLPPVHWNTSDHLTRLRDCLTSLLLPSAPTLPQHADWAVQCAQCMEYVRSVNLPTDDVMAIIPLVSRVKALLHHVEDCSEFFIPWDQVVLVCAEHMVSHLTSDLWVSGFHGNNATETFSLPSEWLKAQAETTLNSLAQVTSKSTPGSIRKRRRHRSDPPYAEVTYSHSPQASLSVGVSPASTLAAHSSVYGVEEEKLRHKLESSLKKEKALSQSFETQLQQWLSHSAAAVSSEPSATKRQPTRSRRSAELEHSRLSREGEGEDKFEHCGGSLRKGLEQLRKKIRLAKYLDTKDNIHLHSLVNSPHLPSSQP